MTDETEPRGVGAVPPARRKDELTTWEAADLLNVSLPYVKGLLDEGKLPCRGGEGLYRRIALADLLSHREESDARSRAAREQLTAEAQELDMGY